MREFSDWIQDLGLMDIPLHGLKFTWRRNDLKSRLAMGLCCNEWLRKFPNMILRGEKRSSSDHNPIVLLSEAKVNWGPTPFRCFDAWFINPGFRKFVSDEWLNLHGLSLDKKLKALKGPLRNWSKKYFEPLDNRIDELEKTVHELEGLSDIRTLDDIELARLKATKNILHSLLIRRESIWR